MNNEEKIKKQLIDKFSYLAGKIKVQRIRRISLEVDLSNFNEVFNYAIKNLSLSHLCAITGLDEGANLGVIYHLACNDGTILNIKVSVPKENPVLKTVTPYFPCAEIYERELIDLLGAKIDTLVPGSRYPLPDDWPIDQFPLRKDWHPK